MASEERFGYAWGKYPAMYPLYEGQFRVWIGSMTPKDFQGRDVLDAGCGMGRNSYWALKYGARSLTAFDNDERSLASARKTLALFPNARVVRSDISETPWRHEFDIVMCIGVLHHLRNPEKALQNFVRSLRPGGRLVIWVYGYEGNAMIIRMVNGLRTFTSRLPLPLVHFLSLMFALPLWIFVKIVKGPTAYLKQLSEFEFWHVRSIVFDQLIPRVSNYWRYDEIDQLLKSIPLRTYTIEKPKNGNGWVLHGVM